MPSVARAVAEIVEKRPFLEEALATEIVNYSYLAELLKPDVENEIGRGGETLSDNYGAEEARRKP